MIRRVALLSPYALSVFGGVQEQVLAQSRALSATGVEVLVVAPDHRDDARYDTPARVERFGARLAMPANGSRAPLTLSPRASRAARRAVRDFAPDVVHLHEPLAPLLGWATLRAHDVAAVGTFHRAGSGPAITLTTPLLRRLARGLDEVVAVSEAAATTALAACGRRAEVLYNGFELERFVASPRRRDEVVTIFFVGRFEERKGVATLIDAFRRRPRSGPSWRLVLAGDGPERGRLVARAGDDERVTFLGAISDEEKRAWQRRSDVVVAPSLHGESFGLVLLEAMAAEAAVVASDIDGYRDAAGGHATLFAPGDPDALLAAIERALIESSDARVEAARAHAARWSMGSLVEAYLERYDRAIHAFSAAR